MPLRSPAAFHGGNLLIFRQFVDTSWSIFKWGLFLCVVAGLVLGLYLYRKMDDTVCALVQKELALRFPSLEVEVGSVQIVESKGIAIRQLAFYEPSEEGTRQVLLEVQEAFLFCKADLEGLIQRKIAPSHLILNEPRLHVWRLADQSWHGPQLLVPRREKKQGLLDETPIAVRDGNIDLIDQTRSPPRNLLISDINFTVEPKSLPESSSKRFDVVGFCTGAFADRIEAEGRFLASEEGEFDWQVAGTVRHLNVRSELLEDLPIALVEKEPALKTLRGVVDCDFTARKDAQAADGVRFDIQGTLAEGRMEVPIYERPLTEIEVGFHFTNEFLQIAPFRATSGSTVFEVAFVQQGCTPGSPARLESTIKKLAINQEVIDHIRDDFPPSLCEKLTEFAPEGVVDLKSSLVYDGRQWTPRLIQLDLIDLAITYKDFPYPLEHARGRLTVDEAQKMTFHLVSGTGRGQIRIDGDFENTFHQMSGLCEIRAGSIPIDRELLKAVPPKPREVISSLQPTGRVQAYLKLRKPPGGLPVEKHYQLGVSECSIRYEKFPYPMTNIHGILEFREGEGWVFRDLVGENGLAEFRASGYLLPNDRANELKLNLEASGLPLEDELRNALQNANQRALWDGLRPVGKVDLQTEIRFLPSEKRLYVAFDAVPYPGETSIHPKQFPYRLDQLEGVVRFRDGQITIDRFRGRHGETLVSSEIRCHLFDDGSWRLSMAPVMVDQLHADREFLQAAPMNLGEFIEGVQLEGPLNLEGAIRFAKGASPESPLKAFWDLEVFLHQGAAQVGVPLKNICGAVKLSGEHDGSDYYFRGHLDLDSVTYDRYQLTHVAGPFYSEGKRLFFGQSVPPQASEASGASAAGPNGSPSGTEAISANLFGGTATCSGSVLLEHSPSYRIYARLHRASLAYAARELMAGAQDLRGNLHAWVDLWGQGSNQNAMGGQGSIILEDADLYELPKMIQLLQILGIGEPDRSAFTSSDIAFRIQGNHVLLDPVNFEGSAFGLTGRGEMNIDQKTISLKFGTRLGKRQHRVPVVNDLLGEAGEQIAILRVEGPLDDPVITRESLPGVRNAIEQLQNDFQPPKPKKRGFLAEWMRQAEKRRKSLTHKGMSFLK